MFWSERSNLVRPVLIKNSVVNNFFLDTITVVIIDTLRTKEDVINCDNLKCRDSGFVSRDETFSLVVSRPPDSTNGDQWVEDVLLRAWV